MAQENNLLDIGIRAETTPEEGFKLRFDIPDPVGHFESPHLSSHIAVYKRFNRFQRWCIYVCFGLKYVEDVSQN